MNFDHQEEEEQNPPPADAPPAQDAAAAAPAATPKRTSKRKKSHNQHLVRTRFTVTGVKNGKELESMPGTILISSKIEKILASLTLQIFVPNRLPMGREVALKMNHTSQGVISLLGQVIQCQELTSSSHIISAQNPNNANRFSIQVLLAVSDFQGHEKIVNFLTAAEEEFFPMQSQRRKKAA